MQAGIPVEATTSHFADSRVAFYFIPDIIYLPVQQNS